ncbi:2-oxoacid:ferredoxin oxidoreductase subunit gamma [Heliorestis acidaminivorans]|uniref:2-oxoacid:ferredoxin oxidoreductase subunit gamma n=1 Tax=Heliorestis acidaminivorans TaxID=553427 RepID=A0A6I0EWJ6_9FIRM|nr:2-oxoacid:acceptor oxidoreductase family protein [Heliorestis acidaminivorans]KAB2952517.1 2-oxoacid:ferredoxin oxidoreductase subunit gamma [Heliorestis acidaminivorans]
MEHRIILAGFGGQGVMLTGQLMTYAGMMEGKEVAWIPSYGPEMRGGTANCSITIADKPIASPIVYEPTVAIVLNQPSLEKFAPKVVPGGLLMINSSLVNGQSDRTDIRQIGLKANDLANEIGDSKVANMVILGSLIGLTGIISMESILESLRKVLPPHRHKLIPMNQQALEKGMEQVLSLS